MKWGYPHFNAYNVGVDSVLADTFLHMKGVDRSQNGKRRKSAVSSIPLDGGIQNHEKKTLTPADCGRKGFGR